MLGPNAQPNKRRTARGNHAEGVLSPFFLSYPLFSFFFPLSKIVRMALGLELRAAAFGLEAASPRRGRRARPAAPLGLDLGGQDQVPQAAENFLTIRLLGALVFLREMKLIGSGEASAGQAAQALQRRGREAAHLRQRDP